MTLLFPLFLSSSSLAKCAIATIEPLTVIMILYSLKLTAVVACVKIVMKELLGCTVKNVAPFTLEMFLLNRVTRVAVTWLDLLAMSAMHKMDPALVATAGKVERATR